MADIPLKTPIELRVRDLNVNGVMFQYWEIDKDKVEEMLEEGNLSDDHELPEVAEEGRKDKSIKLVDLDLTCDIESMINLVEDGGIRKSRIKVSDGIPVKPKSRVSFHCIQGVHGELEPFDSSLWRDNPKEVIDLREENYISGLVVALESMCLNEISKFWIRHDYAYGSIGCPPRIGPFANVVFLIEVVDVVYAEQSSSVEYMTKAERQMQPFSDIYDTAKFFRTNANGMYVKGCYFDAIKIYKKATNMLEDYSTLNEEEFDLRENLLSTLYQNLAIAYIKLSKYRQACIACHLALRYKNMEKMQLIKTLYRFGIATFRLGQLDRSLSFATKAEKLDCPNCTSDTCPKITHNLVIDIKNAKMKEEEVIKSLYTKMGESVKSNDS